MSPRLNALAIGDAPGLSTRWQELHASGTDFGTAAPRLAHLTSADLRSGPLFAEARFRDRLLDQHRRLGADATSIAAVEALGNGAACVITGQQPHLLTGPFYTAYKILGAIVLARRLQELHGRPVVPVYWCGADDTDFDEISSAWGFDPGEGPWRLAVPASAWSAGQPVGSLAASEFARLERAAADRLTGPGTRALHEKVGSLAGQDFGERAAAWALQLFAGRGLVVVDARDPELRRAARPLLDRYCASREEIAEAVQARGAERERQGWPRALDPAATESGLFALQDGRRIKLTGDDLDTGTARSLDWSPSVLLRPVVQDALLAPVAAVLGPGEMAYHAELGPVYARLGVEAARPAPRPHLTLTDAAWGWPEQPAALLSGGAPAEELLSRLLLDPGAVEAFDRLGQRVDGALAELERELGHPLRGRSRERMLKEVRRMAQAEAEQGDARVRRGVEWMARGRVPQERLYSCWHLWAWFEDPWASVLDPLGAAWVDAVDRGTSVQWALPVEVPR